MKATIALTSIPASSPQGADTEAAVQPLQQELQRKLGRCMIRLQQCEGALKTLLAGMALDRLPTARARRSANLRMKTLGMLVGAFTGGHLVAEGVSAAPEDADRELDEASVTSARVRMDFSFSLPAERFEQTCAALGELVTLRNELVHHFIERFDIAGESGCRAGIAYLDACYTQIDESSKSIHIWLMVLAAAEAKFSQLMQSEDYENLFLHGISADGTVT